MSPRTDVIMLYRYHVKECQPCLTLPGWLHVSIQPVYFRGPMFAAVPSFLIIFPIISMVRHAYGGERM